MVLDSGKKGKITTTCPCSVYNTGFEWGLELKRVNLIQRREEEGEDFSF